MIELVVVMGIISVLSSAAIPNFLRYQLRVKNGEAKVHLAAIRTAEEAYFAEFGLYVSCGDSPPAWTSGPSAVAGMPWTDGGGFGAVGWKPEGDVRFQYHVEDPGGTGTEFVAEARSDLDGDTTENVWGLVNPAPLQAQASADGSWGCASTGVIAEGSGISQIGPCCVDCGKMIY